MVIFYHTKLHVFVLGREITFPCAQVDWWWRRPSLRSCRHRSGWMQPNNRWWVMQHNIIGVAVLMATYWVYGFQYPKYLKKTFCFLEHYVFNLKTTKSAPVPVNACIQTWCVDSIMLLVLAPVSTICCQILWYICTKTLSLCMNNKFV